MELDIIKLQTTWNDAASAINSNFAKLLQAINAGVGNEGFNEEELRNFLESSGYTTEEWVLARGYITASSLVPYAKKEDLSSYATIAALSTLEGKYNVLRGEFDALSNLLSSDTSDYINTWNEVVAFLDGYKDESDLATILSGMNADISSRLLASDFESWKTNTFTPLANLVANHTTRLDGIDQSILSINTKIEGVDKAIEDHIAEFIAFRANFEITDNLILVRKNFASTKEVSAKGINQGTGGGGGSSYSRLDTWDGYDNNKAGYVLSAGLGYGLKVAVDELNGYDLDNRVRSIENSYVSKDAGGVVNGGLVVSSLAIAGGSSSQFLKADGSLDGTSYMPTIGGVVSGLVYIKTPDTNPLQIFSSSGVQSGTIWYLNDIPKSWFGYDANGTNMYDYAHAAMLGIANDGTPHYNGKPLLHSGNVGNYALKTDGSNTMNGGIKWTLEPTPSSWDNYFNVGGNHGLRILNNVGHSTEGAPSNYAVALAVSGYYGFALAYDANGSIFKAKGFDSTDWKTIAFIDSTVANSTQLDGLSSINYAKNVLGEAIDLNDIRRGLRGGKLYAASNAVSPSSSYRGFLEFVDEGYGGQLNQDQYGLYYRYCEASAWSAWKTIAFTDSNLLTSLGYRYTTYNDDEKFIILGLDTAKYGYTTYIDGHNIELRSNGTSMLINSSGNVTIGNGDLVDSGEKLHVDGRVRSKGIGINRESDNAEAFFLMPKSNNALQFQATGGGGFFSFHTAYNGMGERMRIANNGNVGIGATNPQYRLDVAGDVGITSTNGYIDLVNGQVPGNASLTLSVNGTSYAQIQTSHYGVAYTCPLYINPNGGNVLIGTNVDSGEKLQVESSANTVLAIRGTTYPEASIAYIGSDGKLWTAGKGIMSHGDSFGFYSATAGRDIVRFTTEGAIINGTLNAGATSLSSLYVSSDIVTDRIIIGGVTLSTEDGVLKIESDMYATGEISAHGLNKGESGGGGSSYSRLDTWIGYDSSKAGYVLSAGLGYDLKLAVDELNGYNLNSRLTTVESNYLSKNGGVATNLTLYGGTINGDFIIDRSISTILYYKDGVRLGFMGFRDELEPIIYDAAGHYSYDILHSGNIGSYALSTSGGTIGGSLTVDSSSLSPLLINTSHSSGIGLRLAQNHTLKAEFNWDIYAGTYMYNHPSSSYIGVKDDGTPHYNGNTLIHSGNIGSQSVAYATNAGGTQGSTSSINFARGHNRLEMINSLMDGTVGDFAYAYQSGISVITEYVGWQMTSYGGATENPYFRSLEDTGRWKPWRKLAFIDDNVASATKLATSRTIWGQSFDGTGDVENPAKMQILRFVNTNGSTDSYIGRGATNHNGIFVYIPTEDDFSIYTKGEQRMLINSSGNVGIGTTDPKEKLDVDSTFRVFNATNDVCLLVSSTASYVMRLASLNTAESAWYAMSLGYNNQLYLNSASTKNNYVGINTDNPIYQLHVDGTGYFSGALTANGILTVGGASIHPTANNPYFQLYQNNNYWYWQADDNYTYIGGTMSKALRIDQDGNTLIRGSLGVDALLTASNGLTVSGLSTLTGGIATNDIHGNGQSLYLGNASNNAYIKVRENMSGVDGMWSIPRNGNVVFNTLTVNGASLFRASVAMEAAVVLDSTLTVSDATTLSSLSVSGNTELQGDLRLRPSGKDFGSSLKFGDGSFCCIQEDTDDHMKVTARHGVTFESSEGTITIPKLSVGINGMAVNGPATFNDFIYGSSITPKTDNYYVLGNNNYKWYAVTAYNVNVHDAITIEAGKELRFKDDNGVVHTLKYDSDKEAFVFDGNVNATGEMSALTINA